MNSACDYCGLPVRGGVADGPLYCCSGCRFAASITAAGGGDGQARWMMTCLGLAAFFSMNVMVFTFFLWSEAAPNETSGQARALFDLARYASLVFTVPVLLLLGGPLVESAAVDLWRGRLSIDLLLVTGVAAAFAISVWATWQGQGHVYFEVACMVLVAVTLGRWFEASGKLQTTAALRDLESLLPDRVRRLREASDRHNIGMTSEVEIPLAEVEVGDLLRILPGEQVPVDATIESGRAAMDERTVSGESEPVVRGPGDVVRSGTTNLDGELVVTVTAPPGAGTLEQLIAAVTVAVGTSGSTRVADRIATWFLPAVLLIAVVTCGFHWWYRGPAAGVLAGLAVVVVSCPCALGLATPMALWAAVGRCMRRQVLVREGDALERLASVNTFCLDKTGTLTTGCRVERVEIIGDGNRDETLAIAAALARGSTHVTAEAIAAMIAREGIEPASISDVKSVAGLGVQARTRSGEAIRLGSPEWIAAQAWGSSQTSSALPLRGRHPPIAPSPPPLPLGEGRGEGAFVANQRVSEAPSPGLRPASPRGRGEPSGDVASKQDVCRTEPGSSFSHGPESPRCVLTIGEKVVAGFWITEQVRQSAEGAVAGLVSRGRHVTILSGDQPLRVKAVADRLGVTWQAPLVPAEKLIAIEKLQCKGRVAMVGDGINDAAALAAADVGIALGCGADIARWTAPICLLDDNLSHLPWLVDLAVETRRTIRWNLLWAFGYNAACIPLAASGFVHPALAALAMVASSLLVVGNSLRLGKAEVAA